jgi:uncharacterized membrane protein (DUF2068 family)
MATAPRVRLLRLIALFKLVKAVALLVSLATVFNVVRQDDPAHTVITWALRLHVDPDNHYLRTVLAAIFRLDPKQLELLAAGTVFYAVLFCVEGIGLWYGRAWAEYMTVVATAGFIPIELYEIIKRISIAKTAALFLNVAIVAYLIIDLRRHNAQQRAAPSGTG